MTKQNTKLKIYNTLTKQQELFVPITPKKIGLYVCGNTVYDYAHIGNARVFVFFDVVVRYLTSQGYDVTYVRNLTDIDDKIIKRAQEMKISCEEVTTRFIDALHDDLQKLGVKSPSFEPKVTENVDKIIDLIQILTDKNYAYVATNGDVYYDTSKFKTYGELAHQNLDNLRIGARIEVDEVKHNPLDFVLWKMAKPEEPAWDSPWGKGRPGWHIECSAMSQCYLGKGFDIHGGGIDLQFPHHQNELAQSEAAYGCRFVNYWMHVGFVNANNEKMSKSLGNFFTVRELLQKHHPETLRFFLLSCHYRSPLGFSLNLLDMAQASLDRLYTTIRGLELSPLANDQTNRPDITNEFWQKFENALNDDFNIPQALSFMFELAHAINLERNSQDAKNNKEKILSLATTLRHMGSILGILQNDPEQFFKTRTGIAVDKTDNQDIQSKITAREQARRDKSWTKADQIRNELEAIGVILEDTPQGTMWKVKK